MTRKLQDILIVDDSYRYACALEGALAPFGYRIESVYSYDAATAVIEHKAFVAYLVDYNLGNADGISLARKILALQPQAKVLILTAYADPEAVRRGFDLGIMGFLEKTDQVSKIHTSIQDAIAGRKVVIGKPIEWLLEEFGKPKLRLGDEGKIQRFLDTYEGLGERDQMLVRCLAEGKSADEIARILHINSASVRTYSSSLYKKFEARNRTEIMSLAFKSGLV